MSNPEGFVRHKSKWKKVLAIVGVVTLLIIGLFRYFIFQGVKDTLQAQQKVTSFLQNVSNDDLDSAYTLTSKLFKDVTTKESFSKAMILLKVEFTGFKEQKQTSFSVEANTGKLTLYKYSGTVTYTDGDQGKLSAILVKEDSEWKILSIKVDVSLKRLEKFQQTNDKSVSDINTEK